MQAQREDSKMKQGKSKTNIKEQPEELLEQSKKRGQRKAFTKNRKYFRNPRNQRKGQTDHKRTARRNV